MQQSDSRFHFDLESLPSSLFGCAARAFSEDVIGGDAGKVLSVVLDDRETFLACLGEIGRDDEFAAYALAMADPESFEGCPGGLKR